MISINIDNIYKVIHLILITNYIISYLGISTDLIQKATPPRPKYLLEFKMYDLLAQMRKKWYK